MTLSTVGRGLGLDLAESFVGAAAWLLFGWAAEVSLGCAAEVFVLFE